MSQVWIFLEFMDRLPLIGLSILLKEIQLIHQQFVVSQFRAAVEKEEKKVAGIVEEEDLNQILKKRPVINVGIFGSIQHTLRAQKPEICTELLQQVRTSFRVISLEKPDMKYLFKSYLSMENFALPMDVGDMLIQFFKYFREAKREKLYAGKIEDPGTGEELSLSNLRTALKLSQLLKDQEWRAYWEAQLARDAEEFKVQTTLDKFEVEASRDDIDRW